jgi:hypothetical protein
MLLKDCFTKTGKPTKKFKKALDEAHERYQNQPDPYAGTERKRPADQDIFDWIREQPGYRPAMDGLAKFVEESTRGQ